MIVSSRRGMAVAAGAVLAIAGGTFAQTTAPAGVAPGNQPTMAPAQPRSTGDARRDTLNRFMRPVSIEFKETRLEDVMKFLTEVTQADVEIFWMDDRNSIGLDKEQPLTLKSERMTGLMLLEKILESAATDATGSGGNSWQLSASGAMQIGPKARLNIYKRVELYSVQDLILETPNYTNAPEFDLQSVLQQTGGGGGGGGGQSPFRDNNQGQQTPVRTPEQRTQEVVDIITTLVENEQWVDNGGDGATIRPFQGSLIVNAPDYIHRQINGYPYWPAASTRVAMNKGRRYVTLGIDTSINTIDGIRQVPITAITGNGNLVNSNPGGPGGSATPPATTPPAAKPPK